MGAELGAVYSELWQEVARLHIKWDEYVELFGTKESRVELLNEAAPHFFGTIQSTLWDAVLLHIARLTDPAQSRAKGGLRQNLTVRRMTPLIANPQARQDMEYAIEELDKACVFARDWRNRRIAHGDYDLAMNQSAEPLSDASRLHVKAALAGLTATLNVVSITYLDRTNLFDSGPSVGGAVELLYVIDRGVQAHRARAERIKTGQFDPDDFKPRDL
jgi:hypothetical protein